MSRANFPTLYLIHGWTYTTEPWTQTLDQLRSSGVTVKMLHVPGLTSPSDQVWDIASYVRWADQHLPQNAIVLGHSNGGRILLNLCASQPQRLKHLILLNSAGVYQYSLKRVLLKTLAKIFQPLKKLPFLRRIFHRLIRASDYSRAPENMKQTLANMLNSDRRLNLSKITTPTTILWGQNDKITPPSQGKILHQKLKNSTLKFYPWSHAPYITHPATLANEIIQIIQKIEAKS